MRIPRLSAAFMLSFVAALAAILVPIWVVSLVEIPPNPPVIRKSFMNDSDPPAISPQCAPFPRSPNSDITLSCMNCSYSASCSLSLNSSPLFALLAIDSFVAASRNWFLPKSHASPSDIACHVLRPKSERKRSPLRSFSE